MEHALAIKNGFDELWVVEDLPFAGGISQAAAVLAATDEVAVGHGIAPAPFRNPAALAMEWATLAELFPGRFIGGLGHGVQHWMGQVGDRVGSPLTLLKESILAVRRLLAGESVTVAGRYVQLDAVKLEYPPAQVPMVLAGVTGPKSLLLSGAVADGTVLPEGHGPQEITRARQLTDLGREEAGRTDHHHLTVFAGFYVGELAGLDVPNPDAPPGWDAVGARADEVTAKLQTLMEAGADSVVLVPFGKDVTSQLQQAAADVVPQLVRG
jgi:alkanesulfonate monooxygenase SsuD/methylene tetrahydromethanopterin reductase-like flavin-dependent oxidoreductase (luciferase family)